MRSSAWMNRNGPPSSADCHWFDDTTTCLKLGRIRYSRQFGHAEVLGERALAREVRGGGDVHQHRGLRARGSCCAVSRTGTRGGVNANHWSVDQVRVVGDDARDVGLRRRPCQRESQVAPRLLARTRSSIGCTWPSAWKLPSGRCTPHCSFERLAVVERRRPRRRTRSHRRRRPSPAAGPACAAAAGTTPRWPWRRRCSRCSCPSPACGRGRARTAGRRRDPLTPTGP